MESKQCIKIGMANGGLNVTGRKYGKIFHLQLDVIKEKDQHIKELVLLCLDRGTIGSGGSNLGGRDGQ